MSASSVCLGVLIVSLCLVSSASLACNQGSNSKPQPASGDVVLDSAGSTFIEPIMAKWIDEFGRTHPGKTIGYRGISSGAGIAGIVDGAIDLGASDSPMTDDQLKQAKQNVFHLPAVLGSDVVAYNLPGVSEELNCTPEVLAGIFLGKIKRWNDPGLGRANPRVQLPPAEIVVVHRSDVSGTTYIWTDYLSSVSDEWKWRFGKRLVLGWPAGTLDGNGNQGVVDLIRQTPYSVGYVPSNLADARKKRATADFLRWILTDGQRFAQPLGYAPLPEQVVSKEMKAVTQIE
jgi:phosphate transport system substrate-binding protein